MYTVSFHTFGCKLNQAETAAIVKDFENRGYRVISRDQSADVFVLNSCTVTGRSDAKCRRAIRHTLKINPKTTVIVVGCYSQVAADEICQIEGVDYVLGTKEKFQIFDHFPGPGKLSHPKRCITPVEKLKEATSPLGNYLDHTRAFLKIQDGCNHRCSYCIVPLARGPNRSVSVEEVLHQTEILIHQGYREIVLTGVHIGAYGKEFGKGSLLSGLLHRLMRVEGLDRIRLSSLDPEDITDELLKCIAGSEKICRHLHIPLQSGCDTILASMSRRHTTETFRKKIEKIVKKLGDVGLGTDVIVGFPGETEEMFEETYKLIEELPFTYLHVFPFSPRKNTKAASMPNKTDPRVRTERAERLRTLGEKKKEQFVQKWMDQVVKVLLERRNRNGWMGGFTSEYLRVEVPYKATLKNQLVNVKIEKVSRSAARGRVVN